MSSENTLRTLKDIDFEADELEVGHLVENERIYKILKQEAIKWVKKFDERWENEDFTDYGGELSKWIEHFFNLTEDDLK
jgi:hypothetical protein